MKHIHEEGYQFIMLELEKAFQELDKEDSVNVHLAKQYILNVKGTLKANEKTKPRQPRKTFVSEERW